MILESAYALADYTEQHYLEQGRIFPPINDLHQVSHYITKRILTLAVKENIATNPDLNLANLDAQIEYHRWKPEYLPYVLAPDSKNQESVREYES